MAWTAPEYAHRPKNISWYWLSIILALLILGLAIWQSNYLFGFFVLAAEILILVWGERPPRMVDFSLNEKGLTINGVKFYPWSDLKAFSVEEESREHLDWVDIAIFSGHLVRPSLNIRAPHEEISQIREIFKTKLKEMSWEPNFLDSLERLLRF